jgi:hypothetical protein
MRVFRAASVFLILLCLVPPLVLLIASMIARWSGCELDPDAPVACHILGGDYGDILYSMTHFGWLTVATLPALAALVASWALIELVRAAGGAAKPAAHTPANSRNRVRGS